MPKEEIERLAKYATDSYFTNLDVERKNDLIADRNTYVANYVNVFETALTQINKMQEEKKIYEANASQFK